MASASIVELLPAFGVFPFRCRALTEEPVTIRPGELIGPNICLISEAKLSENAWLLMGGDFEISMVRLGIRENVEIDPRNPLIIGIPNLAAERSALFSLTTRSACAAQRMNFTDLAQLLASDVESRLQLLTGLARVVRRQREVIVRAAEVSDHGL